MSEGGGIESERRKDVILTLHIMFLGMRILKTDRLGKGKYHALMAHLYCEAVLGANVSDADLAGAAKLPDLDFDGMEE
ncbi:hypothetical protein DFJ43DRAFT_1149848 [Lentinula guzmanii]|uniref:Uncharacterized protein n=1 Tax=Lentinula guzmanii TaxID=2804957 RepID=A0AA38K153_9AGAR|nr:hypothetical protein DFJ43DRAFT_1149848 [Lentinula guzmanii]